MNENRVLLNPIIWQMKENYFARWGHAEMADCIRRNPQQQLFSIVLNLII